MLFLKNVFRPNTGWLGSFSMHMGTTVSSPSASVLKITFQGAVIIA